MVSADVKTAGRDPVEVSVASSTGQWNGREVDHLFPASEIDRTTGKTAKIAIAIAAVITLTGVILSTACPSDSKCREWGITLAVTPAIVTALSCFGYYCCRR